MEGYSIEIERLRSERRMSMKKIEQSTLEIENILNVFALDSGQTLISWNDLIAAKMGKSYSVNSKVSFIKYFQNQTTLKFKCYAEAGGTFGFQEHNCLEETKIITGHLIETLRDDKEYTEGQVISYQPREMHKPHFEKDSVLDVIFTKKP